MVMFEPDNWFLEPRPLVRHGRLSVHGESVTFSLVTDKVSVTNKRPAGSINRAPTYLRTSIICLCIFPLEAKISFI